jgi:ApaG protein
MYVETQSIPDEERYVFAYQITVRNLGRYNVQLVGRYWLITNANGKEFQYTSGAILETPLGTMEGHYEMLDHQGQSFQIAIPVFRLAIPTLIH